ncbi:MAG: nuclear transport factor 2 family protein [Deltaproteobacteria bacterium]|nr:nuclear transport factor 2 family protein [Deltaproteobacteria bacterium]
MMSFKKEVILICAALFVLCGCATTAQNKNHDMETYYQALHNTEPHEDKTLQPGSERERAAIALFVALYSTYTDENIKKYVRDLYAQDAYYCDSFTEMQGIENIEAYLIQGTHIMQVLTFDLQDVAVHDGNYYFRWITRFTLKRKKGEVIHFPGMSHVRFNKEGRIVFQHDFWDAGVIYERLPIVGFFIRWLKKRM